MSNNALIWFYLTPNFFKISKSFPVEDTEELFEIIEILKADLMKDDNEWIQVERVDPRATWVYCRMTLDYPTIFNTRRIGKDSGPSSDCWFQDWLEPWELLAEAEAGDLVVTVIDYVEKARLEKTRQEVWKAFKTDLGNKGV